MTSRTLAIGDVHGCDVALETLLETLQPTRDDTVVVLGDVVDRGPNSKRCVELLLDLQDSTRLVFLLGNHEEMMLDACDRGEWASAWPGYGGAETLKSYGCKLADLPETHLEFLRGGLDYFETSQSIFVHANLAPNLPLDRQPRQWLRWVHLTGNENPIPSGKRVVCGHTRLPDGIPRVMDGWICIDTFACGGQYLTALDVNTDVVYQSSQDGSYRGEFPLAEIALVFKASDL